jgi:imidazolonepropionase-like amidohydrolase
MRKLLLLGFLLSFISVKAQVTFPTNGVKDERPDIYAFTNATLHVDYQTVIENATLLIKEDRVVASGTSVSIPQGTTQIDLKGKHIYPSFIELSSKIGLPDASSSRSRNPVYNPEIKGAFNANDAIKSYFDAVSEFKMNDSEADKLRKAGFGVALTHSKDGLVRGTGALVALRDARENEVILKEKASSHFSFDKGSSRMDNPSSLMGSIALIKQTYLNANWYKKQDELVDLSLAAFNENRSLPQFFEAGRDKLFVLRADQLGDEMGVQYIIKGAGDEYQRLDEIKATNATLIVPVNFPDAYDVEDPFNAINVGYDDMKHWEFAAHNLKMLNDKGITFAITSDDLKDASKLSAMLEKAVEAGLSEDVALKALTYTPAQLLNVQNDVGSLTNGKVANFIVTDGSPFKKDTKIYQNWVQGKKHEFTALDTEDLAGKYKLSIDGNSYDLEVSGEPGKQSFKIIINDSTKWDVKSSMKKELITLSFMPEDDNFEGKLRLSGWKTENGFSGNTQLASGEWVNWTAERTGDLETKEDEKKDEEKKEEEEDENDEIGDLIYPFTAFGQPEKPKAETILIKNATVWTNEDAGVLENTDVLLDGGKISKIGKDLSAGSAIVIDGTGKHLTAGIVDEHSHIAISYGVNEGSEAITAEVNIEDVVNSEDINIYRQLSGGTTTSQLLHGSANPIGGRSAIVKLKWGYGPEEMKIKGADKFIKFALGENVKQSNWGSDYDERFPQTRMGVEQVYVDAFTRAREYEAEWKKYNGLSKRDKANATAPRRDLELETLVEILNSKRFITCHSYVQSEINMLMNVAEDFDFRINTFTHILEGYKVADKMKSHGVGGSTFSDWWAYKFEVNDAIPYNAALMNGEGVVTAINSDDAEMGRRLNQEAAKTVKYGGVAEQEALKMVTLNPAKLLHLDDRIGSIKEGKDGDVVLWSDHPLSIYAKAEKTIIEGAVFFDADKQEEMQEAIQKERARLVAKMQGDKKKGKATQQPTPKSNIIYHCETEIDFFSSLK